MRVYHFVRQVNAKGRLYEDLILFIKDTWNFLASSYMLEKGKSYVFAELLVILLRNSSKRFYFTRKQSNEVHIIMRVSYNHRN